MSRTMLWIGAFVVVAATVPAANAARITSDCYVQSGLVALLDAENNEGNGTQNLSAATWRPIVGGEGNAYVNCVSGSSWHHRYFRSTTTQNYIKGQHACA